jgi:hypothetical protein
MRRLYRIAVCAVALEALGAAYSFVLLPRLRRWGASADEVARALPGDDLVADPLHVATHAITLRAAAEDVFPWVVQIGQNRGGFYSYDFLENLLKLDIHSAEAIHPEWQDLRPGEDYMTLDPDGYMKLAVVTQDAPHAFVVRSGAPGEPQPPGDLFKGEIDCSWAFVVEPLDGHTSRLIIRWRAAWRRTARAAFALAFMLEPMHFLMEERMLRGIRERAEKAAAA